MNTATYHTDPYEQTHDSISIKVSFLDLDGENVEFVVVFNTTKVSKNYRDDIPHITNQKIREILESHDTFMDKYEIAITSRDFD